jgi:cytochrome c5
MMKLDLLSAALISAALLTAPAMARESQVTSERLTANANARTPTGALSTSGQACCRNRARDLPGLGDRDAWGHWGAYYGPMVHAP